MTAVISREGYQPTFTILLSSPLFVCVPLFKHEMKSRLLLFVVLLPTQNLSCAFVCMYHCRRGIEEIVTKYAAMHAAMQMCI